jgi:hypothetical protein
VAKTHVYPGVDQPDWGANFVRTAAATGKSKYCLPSANPSAKKLVDLSI